MSASLPVEKSKVFDVITNDFRLTLAGYPCWEASIAAAESDIWVKVIPHIDLSQKVIYYPNKKSIKYSDNISTSNNGKLTYSTETITIDDFFNTVPLDIIEAVSKFSDSHWEIVKAIKLIGKDLIALINSNPALAYTIINIEKINSSFSCFSNIDVLHRMIRTRHKEILGLIGFPESERMTKIFSKIDPSFLKIQHIISLKNVLLIQTQDSENILKLLSYAKIINLNLLRLVTSIYKIVTSMTHKLIFVVTKSEKFDDILNSLNEILSCSNQLKLKTPQLVSLTSIEKVNNELKKRLRSRIKRNLTFPKAPLIGNDYIQPIINETELNNWARRQQNCMSSYTNKIHSGKSFFYKVIYNTEESTLELKLHTKGIRMNRLLGKSNRKVSPELRKIVNDWLKENRGK